MHDRPTVWCALGLLLALTAGCRGAQGAPPHVPPADRDHYCDVATHIAFPEEDESSGQEEWLITDRPRRLRDRHRDQVWDLPLPEAVELALAHNRLIRTRSGFLSPQNPLLSNAELAPSVYDPALQQSGALLGARGVEAALADFDTQFSTSMLWGRNELVQNNRFLSGGLSPGETLSEETGTFRTRLEKPLATGGSLALSHDWDYTLNNAPGRLFGSAYAGLVRAEYRQPLWAGAGSQFTRIAGPVGSNLAGVFGVDQGVVIARINQDISIADFEAAVRNLLKDVEDLYWELSLAYRIYDSRLLARNSALATWRVVQAKQSSGIASAADEAQARDIYFQTRAQAEEALAGLYETEGQLRRLVGLVVNDGRIIRPCDEPLAAEFIPDWHIALAEALTRRVELRRQKWAIQSLKLQGKAARSLAHPQLDFVSGYQVNGFGDRLLASKDDDGLTRQGFSSAYGTLTEGDQTGWNLGVEFSMPLGLRQAHAQVRHLELRLAKARAALAAQELEISHELSHAFGQLDRWYATAQTNLNRRLAAQKRLEAYQAEYAADRTTLDLLLRAQSSLAEAQVAYYQSLVEYNKSLADIHYRKGTLLDYNRVELAENAWTPQDYTQALRRAYQQSHALPPQPDGTDPPDFLADPDDPHVDPHVEPQVDLFDPTPSPARFTPTAANPTLPQNQDGWKPTRPKPLPTSP